MLSSPNLIIEGSHPYGEERMWDLAMWLCNELLPDTDYEIVVTFRKFNKEDGDAQGNHIFIDHNNHEIEISNKLTLKQAMVALVHEFIHVKQYMKGMITEDKADMYWKGKYIPNNTPYFDRPWEIHARANELKVYHKYLHGINN